jgi:hypothetical protein
VCPRAGLDLLDKSKCRVRNSAETPTYLRVSYFTAVPLANVEILPLLGGDCILPTLFRFIIHVLGYVVAQLVAALGSIPHEVIGNFH